jgi:acetoin utilization protein AcuC
VYNDPALAIAVALHEFDATVLYIDVDCHHGDGVQELFYEESRALTVSFHESGAFLFPGTGEVEEVGRGGGQGLSVNVPVTPYTHDASWIEALHAVLPPLAARFRPDLIVSSHGADTHIWDPLTHVALTTASFVAQARLIHQLAHTYSEGRWLALGSGGYDWRRVVPRSWAILWAEMAGRALPAEVPGAWHARWDTDPVEPLPRTVLDDPSVSPPMPQAGQVERLNRRTLRAVLKQHQLL